MAGPSIRPPAGKSSRAGGVNKLLATLDGKPLVTYAVDALLATTARPIMVVTGHLHPAASAEFEALGQHHFLAKPYTLTDLGRRLRQLLDSDGRTG